MDLNSKTILVTGGIGSFGKKFTEIVLKKITLRDSLFLAGMNTNKVRWQRRFLKINIRVSGILEGI